MNIHRGGPIITTTLLHQRHHLVIITVIIIVFPYPGVQLSLTSSLWMWRWMQLHVALYAAHNDTFAPSPNANPHRHGKANIGTTCVHQVRCSQTCHTSRLPLDAFAHIAQRAPRRRFWDLRPPMPTTCEVAQQTLFAKKVHCLCGNMCEFFPALISVNRQHGRSMSFIVAFCLSEDPIGLVEECGPTPYICNDGSCCQVHWSHGNSPRHYLKTLCFVRTA